MEFVPRQRRPFAFTITDDDGQESTYMMGRIGLNETVEYGERHGDLNEMREHGFAGIRTLLWLSLRQTYPEITEQQAGEFLPESQFADLVVEFIKKALPWQQEQKIGVKCPECGHRFPFDPNTDSQPLDPEEGSEPDSPVVLHI